MTMFKDVTLFIPTHNRHNYLKRILEYYNDVPLDVLVADSSTTPFATDDLNSRVTYLHLPGERLSQKLYIALSKVKTEFVVMCADDDFTLPDGIVQCVNFLKNNPDYSVAHGNSIAYAKESMREKYTPFSVMYIDQLAFEIADEDPLERLEQLFDPYRTLFCAIHYTRNLQLAYNKDFNFENLFLSEYPPGIIDLCAGKFKELPVLFQVRENAPDSGDKVTANLDVIALDEKYAGEYQKYLSYITDAATAVMPVDRSVFLARLNVIFKRYATQLKIYKQESGKGPFLKKKIGSLIFHIPFIGRKVIMNNRDRVRKNQLTLAVKTSADKANLDKIENLIKKYAATIK